MYSRKDIIIGIVTYQPDIGKLKQCLEAIREQDDKVVVYDNGSQNIEEIENIIRVIFFKYKLIKNIYNVGIAKALDKIMEYAEQNGYAWVLSIDQDSLLQVGIINAYLREINNFSEVGMFTCLIKDRNFADKKYEKQNTLIKEVEYCITSGALTSVNAYKKTQGYDESFFIDCVDFDICYSLRENGYKIYRINHVGLFHEVGHGENKRFLWKKIIIYHEKSFRIYYLARNTILMYKKHKKMFPWYVMIKKELGLFIKIVFYEDNKQSKLKRFWKGILDANRI